MFIGSVVEEDCLCEYILVAGSRRTGITSELLQCLEGGWRTVFFFVVENCGLLLKFLFFVCDFSSLVIGRGREGVKNFRVVARDCW